MSEEEENQDGEWEEQIKHELENLKHKDLRVLVKLYYNQQKHRIGQNNMVWIYGKMQIIEPKRFTWYAKSMKTDEMKLSTEIAKLINNEAIYKQFLSKIRGIGPMMAGGIISYIDDISKFDTISNLWSYAGYGFTDGNVQKRQKGVKSNWNSKLKTHLYKCATQMILAKNEYSKYYNECKATLAKREDLKSINDGKGYKAHIDAMARRKMIKLFLSHIWVEWRKIEGLQITEPYAIRVLGHSPEHMISPSDMIDRGEVVKS